LQINVIVLKLSKAQGKSTFSIQHHRKTKDNQGYPFTTNQKPRNINVSVQNHRTPKDNYYFRFETSKTPQTINVVDLKSPRNQGPSQFSVPENQQFRSKTIKHPRNINMCSVQNHKTNQ
jgi:hypothetical protein